MKATILCYGAVVGLALALATPAAADEVNQKTIFTFSDAVELPGKTLPAGTYTFRLLDSPSSRNIVQVFNKDETQILMTLFAVSAERRERADEPILTFAERAEDAPPAVQYWFYPGRTIGHEFVYPRAQAMKIARAAKTPVLATEAAVDDADAMASAKVTRIDPQGGESDYAERAPAPEADTAQMQTGQAAMEQQVPAARRDPQPVTQTAERLPQTASGDPMLLLLAFSSFLGLSTMRRFRG
jgi:hypothetical protein